MVRISRLFASTPLLGLPPAPKPDPQAAMLDILRRRGRHYGLLAQYEEQRFARSACTRG
jgi:hypothetical protein